MTFNEWIDVYFTSIFDTGRVSYDTARRYINGLRRALRGVPDGDVTAEALLGRIREILRTMDPKKDRTMHTALRGFRSVLTETVSDDDAAKVILSKLRGPDEDCDTVRYEEDIPLYKRISGLASFVQRAFEQVIVFATKLFASGDFSSDVVTAEFLFQSIPVVLSRKKPKDKVRLTDEDRAWLTKHRFDVKGGNLTEDEILEIWQDREREYPMMGAFFCGKDTPHIEIYYRNIKASSIEEFFATVEMVLAHEYMHYVHWSFLGAEFKKRDFYSRILKEAVADFFAVHYLIRDPYLHVYLPSEPIRCPKGKLQVAEDRHRAWVKNRDGNWPYAYALYFYPAWEDINAFPSDHKHYIDSGVFAKFVDVTFAPRAAALEMLFSRI